MPLCCLPPWRVGAWARQQQSWLGAGAQPGVPLRSVLRFFHLVQPSPHKQAMRGARCARAEHGVEATHARRYVRVACLCWPQPHFHGRRGAGGGGGAPQVEVKGPVGGESKAVDVARLVQVLFLDQELRVVRVKQEVRSL